ncbi:MAG: hypothetical protein GEU28_05070 [Dehalococcoidia bacterium]|nr:hypothetical protein [Dehalococcoidia bacterium]
MAAVTFRNAEESDADAIVDLVLNHSISENGTLQYLVGGRAEKVLRRLVAQEGNLYGYEQTTMAERDGGVAGLFMGYSLPEMRVVAPRTFTRLMRMSSPISWPGLIKKQARLTRLESRPPDDSYVLGLIRACEGDAAVISALLAEAEVEAVEEECGALVFNAPATATELIPILEKAGFEEASRLPIPDHWLASQLGFDEIIQYVLKTSYVPPPDEEDDEDAADAEAAGAVD